MSCEYEAEELAVCLRRFVRNGGIDEKNAVKTVTLLRQLILEFDLQLALPNQMLPQKITHVLAFIEPRKAQLAERQLLYYEGIKLDYHKYGLLREWEHSFLIGVFARLNGLKLE